MRRLCPHHTRDAPYLHLLRDVDFAPVFILGLHRSGTTLLYQLLAATQQVNFLSVYHVLRYEEMLYHHIQRTEQQAREELGHLFTTLGVQNRLIDNVRVTPELPEEYGFILRKAGYRPQVRPATLPLFTELCRKVQLVAGARKPLLLKNPGDFPHFLYLNMAFPAAKFIFIHRHPVHVINSQLRALHALLTTKNPYVALLEQGYDRLFQRPVRLWLARLCSSSRCDLGVWWRAAGSRRRLHSHRRPGGAQERLGLGVRQDQRAKMHTHPSMALFPQATTQA